MSEDEPNLKRYAAEMKTQGRLGEAAKWETLEVVSTLLDEGYEANRKTRIAYASLLRALSWMFSRGIWRVPGRRGRRSIRALRDSLSPGTTSRWRGSGSVSSGGAMLA